MAETRKTIEECNPLMYLDYRDPVDAQVVNKQLQFLWNALSILQERIEELERGRD